ncbi:RNA polymerase sigma-70 factor, ECF subfamily [Filimonas lacunae]|uniref:RNA polymerase sigma-70 factor, ECF subfamily n=1 Tax=Filimonas lacunae TaxID=477680 RepID=A0A173MIU3_9BACT|nr:sigma-70 family RNA polymerase sigma factor [Filimonas lacunae]BAV07544.1 RNA polymerase ECF-type sigma factor [Filimonas lacunae]SIT30004.1 RNA polymerase sigma-70 factor, ECF subfamily [Filimonas lacunae]
MQSIREYSDEELFTQIKDGKHWAFAELYNRYWEKLLVVASNKLNDVFLAQEVVQNLFIDVWTRREKIVIQKTANIYLAAALKYKVINARLERTKARQKSGEYTDDSFVAPANAHETLSFQELQQQLETIVTGLPEKCRLVYQMSRHDGFSNKEIASQLDISEKAVEANLTRALRVLREKLKYFSPLHIVFKNILEMI